MIGLSVVCYCSSLLLVPYICIQLYFILIGCYFCLLRFLLAALYLPASYWLFPCIYLLPIGCCPVFTCFLLAAALYLIYCTHPQVGCGPPGGGNQPEQPLLSGEVPSRRIPRQEGGTILFSSFHLFPPTSHAILLQERNVTKFKLVLRSRSKVP